MESKILLTQHSFSSKTDFEQDSQSTFTGKFLPVLDRLSHLYLPFQSLGIIQIFFCVLQIFFTSFWHEFGKFWPRNKMSDLISYISFFSSIYSDKKDEHVILFFVLFVLVLFILVIFLILITHYHKTRRINKPLLYIVRLYFTFFGVAIIHPSATCVGYFLRRSIEFHKSDDIFYLIFSFIVYVQAEFLFYVNQRYVNQTIYIHKNLWSTFDYTLLFFFFIWNPSFLIFSYIFHYYPNWAFIILIILHVVIMLLSLINYLWIPFIVNFGNCLSISIVFSLIFNDVFRIVSENSSKVSQLLFLTVCLSVFVVFTIVAFVVIFFVKRKINAKLSYANFPVSSEDDQKPFEITYEDKFNYFNDYLKLDRSLNKSRIYLLAGFTSASDMFVDFSLVQYCFDKYKSSPQMIILLIHLLSYFKSEKRLFDAVLKQFQLLRRNSNYENFLYTQANRIKIFRQSTSTSFSSVRLSELKVLSNNLENQIKNFWALQTANTNTLEQLEQQQRNLNNLWEESIEDNWSSISFREEHIRFLIETCTDFQKAVQMTTIKDKIDVLMKERDDLCFMSLLHCFPKYISQRKIDSEGNIMSKKSLSSMTTTTTTTSMVNHESTSSGEFDISYEEQVANAIIKFGRLRLSMQNALKFTRPSMDKALISYAIVSIIGAFVVIITTFAMFINSFDSYDDWNREVGALVELRTASAKSFLSLVIYFGKESSRFKIDTVECDTEVDQPFLDLNASFNDLALFYAEEAKYYFSSLMEAILDLSLRRFDIRSMTNLLFDQNINSVLCHYGTIIDQVPWSIEQILNFEILSFSILANDEGLSVQHWFYNNSYWCHNIATIPAVENMFTTIQNALSDDLTLTSNNKINSIYIAMCVIGPAHFLLFILPFPIVIFLYMNDINHLLKIMLSTESEFKEQALLPISNNFTEVNNNSNEIVITRTSLNWKIFLISVFLLILFSVFLVFEEMILLNSKSLTKELHDFGFNSGNFELLRSYLIEILIDLINSVYYVVFPQKYITNNTYKRRIYRILKDLEKNFFEVMNDTPSSTSSIGKDDYIDELISKPRCIEENVFVAKYHDIYKCGSLNQLIATIHSMVEKSAEEITNYNGIFYGEYFSNIYHIIFHHTMPLILNAGNYFSVVQDNTIKQFKSDLLIFFICGMIIIVIWAISLAYIIDNFRRIFDLALCLIRRLSPIAVINNTELANYLLYKKGEEIEMGVTHTIFNNSFDGIICMNIDGIVEIINKSFANDYGYSIEQLVGQLIGSIFDEDSRSKLENQLKLIKNHESNNWSENVICYTNDGRAVPSYVTLFSIKNNEKSLIMVIRDVTILLQKKKKLELAKKQSQDLLEQIMPPKVLMMLKEGKSEISFAVPSASVMFVDIVNFSGFSADLSPQQIMGTLSSLFGAFDTWIQKFPLMTKIKLIGDIYMAACGLFMNNNVPKDHAKECIDFALLVLNILDDTNLKLNINLKIRIGVNTDGPIIAGVLGTENRVFDIIGDTINVASRLEHKSEPGHILMSEKTYDLVKDLGYTILPKGQVFLKGKGDMPAFSI